MYCPDENTFRGCVRHVAQDAEDVHVHGCGIDCERDGLGQTRGAQRETESKYFKLLE